MKAMKKYLNCHYCKQDIEVSPKIDCCPSCGSSLHSCFNCEHYDEKTANQCKEPNAELVINKEKENACPFFTLKTKSKVLKLNKHEQKPASSLLEEAEALFKKTG